MNSPINSFHSLDTALVLTSNIFHLIFSSILYTPPFFVFLPWWLLLETVTWCHHYSVFTYIYSLVIEKDLCEYRNISVKFLCALLVYLCLSSRDLFIFSVRVSPFYSYLCVICTSVLPFTCDLLQNYEACFFNKYHFEIPPLQCCGRCHAHAHCTPTSVGKRQLPLRQHSSVFTFICTYLKCLRSLKIPPTVKYAL
jgi:hypothetical protein